MTVIALVGCLLVVGFTLYLYFVRHLALDTAIMFALAIVIIIAAISFGATYGVQFL